MKSTIVPVVKGCVGDKVISVLRDTGCSGAVIRKELLLERCAKDLSNPEMSVSR